MTQKRKVGFIYEEEARKFLAEKGLDYIESNFYTVRGEIDLIFIDKRKEEETLVFVEVRYRSNKGYGGPLETVDLRKQEKIIASSQVYIRKINWRRNIRYDVIGISPDGKGKNNINWIKNAF